MSDAPLLEMSGLDAGYGKINVLRNVSLTVREGELVGLLGANNAGKSTSDPVPLRHRDAERGHDPFRGRGCHAPAARTRWSSAASCRCRRAGSSFRR